MEKTALRSAQTNALINTLSLEDVELHGKDWLYDCKLRQHSPNTIARRQIVLDQLIWLLKKDGRDKCGRSEIRRYLSYMTDGHLDVGGRWGNRHLTSPVRPRTVHTNFVHLQTFFRWLVKEEVLDASPMDKIDPPVFRQDQIQPFTTEEVQALLEAAKRSFHPRRDEAILYLLLDTGMRADELCSLKRENIRFGSPSKVTVLGKGNKHRTLPFGRKTTKALTSYLNETPKSPTESVFTGDRGTRSGEALTRSGLLQLCKRLEKTAGLNRAKCSPHVFRHTFAVMYLRNGGNIFSLKEMLGHTQLQMVNRYVALAEADIENQHQLASPVDKLGRRFQ